MGKILDSQNKVMYEKNKFTKVNMVPVVTTDNPENPEDVTDNEVKIEEDKGSTQKPLEEPEDNLSSPSVSNNTGTIFPWGDSQTRKTIQGTLTYQLPF